MEASFIWMNSTLHDLSNDTKNTKFGVQMKKFCKLLNSCSYFALVNITFAATKGCVYYGKAERSQEHRL